MNRTCQESFRIHTDEDGEVGRERKGEGRGEEGKGK